MRRAVAKAHPRIAGVDDGAFVRTDRFAPIAAVVLTLPDRLEAARLSRVRVDGRDGTARVVALVRATQDPEGLRALLVDGPVVGGFNVLDLDAIHKALGLPVVAVTRRRPEFARIRRALEKWFPRTAEERYRLLRRHRLLRVPTPGEPLWAAASGCPGQDAVALVRRTMVRGYWPEPLRVAHLIASAASPRRGARGRTFKGNPRGPPPGL